MEKSYAFVYKVADLRRSLADENSMEPLFSEQFLFSSSVVAGLLHGASASETKKRFLYMVSHALKEADRAESLLFQLKSTSDIEEEIFTSIASDCRELIDLIVSIVKSTRASLYS